MNSPLVTYATRPDAAPETELSTLANVYRFLLECGDRRGRIPDKSDPDDARKEVQDAGTYSNST